MTEDLSLTALSLLGRTYLLLSVLLPSTETDTINKKLTILMSYLYGGILQATLGLHNQQVKQSVVLKKDVTCV